MKFSIERAALVKAISQAQSVVERRNTIPILANVLIEATPDGVSFRATDLDTEIVDRTQAQVERPGATTVSASMLNDISRKLPDGALVQISLDNASQRLSVQAGRSNFSLATLPREDFPLMSSSEYSANFSAPAAVLRRLFDKSKFAISNEETRYYLNGVYMHVAQTVTELRKLLDDDEAQIAVSVSETKVRFATPTITLTSKVIDGTFPDYSRVIPSGNSRKLEVDAGDFAKAVDRVATVSSERSRAVKLALDEDRLILSVNAPDAGAADEELPVAYADEALEIGFNAKYLHEIASQIERENAVFLFNGSGDAALIREGGDSSAVYVVMPMRV